MIVGMTTRWLDLLIIVVYMAGVAGIGVYFSRKQDSAETFFIPKKVPSWAMGLSMMATLISSVTFVAYPGSAYAKDWSLLVPGFMVVVTLVVVGAVIIPFYRRQVGMSAYEYFEYRFGRPTRVYASLCFGLTHFSKMGFVFYLMGLTISSITGWNIDAVIIATGVVMVFYSLKGGMQAVIWSDVIQAFLCWLGAFVSLGYLLFVPPGGPGAVFELAMANNKFSFGSTNWDFSKPTIPVLLLYGFSWYFQRYVADQTVVQRYLIAKSDRDAIKGVALGACLTVPIWALFMLIGTSTWAFYKLTGIGLPATITKADQVFPYFVSTQLPEGLAGLFMASLIGAAMTMLASDLNSLASVGVQDFYRPWVKNATDAECLRMARILVAVVGCFSTALGLILSHMKGNALTMWFAVSAMVAGGLAGLFLLAYLSKRTNRIGVYAGMASCSVFTVWAVLTKGASPLVNLGSNWNFPWDDLMIGVCGHVVMFAVGYVVSLAFDGNASV
jgi:solute:Na+ symporter, SSS family